MTPIENVFTTGHLGQPDDWDEKEHGPCGNLPVHLSILDNGNRIWTSWHRPTWRERIKLALGVPVRLTVMSNVGHPPIALEVLAG